MSRRQPAESMPTSMRRDLREAERNNVVLTSNGIKCYPPSSGRKTWRIVSNFDGRTVERSGGRNVYSAYAAYQVVLEERHAAQSAGEGRPEKESKTIRELVDAYFVARGPNNKWSDETLRQRKQDFAHLVEAAGKIRCRDLNASHLRTYLLKAAGTKSRASHFKNVTGTLLEWAFGAGYVTLEQSKLMKRVTWAPAQYAAAPTRREQARLHAVATGAASVGNVPTHQQVFDWAQEAQQRNDHAELLILVSAFLGTRENETLLFSADALLAATGVVNFVDVTAWEARVRLQVDKAKGARLPKMSKQRDVVIPAASVLPNSFDLRAAMAQRHAEALTEQAAGTNDLALFFPTASGLIWDDDNLRKRVIDPAADALGWRMAPYKTAKGKSRAMLRFTLHSLRDRFATTAINEWKYTEEMVLEQGSWEDPETVRRCYSGVTDDTHSQVRALHGLAG